MRLKRYVIYNMQNYYTNKYKTVYTKGSSQPFKLSRSKIDSFMECPRCFYLDRRLGVGRPSIPAFTLNVAVDALLKKEFDILRDKKETHPLLKKYNIDAIPFSHPMMETWRANFTGIQYHHKITNFILFGAVDDIWINPNGELIVVDYKATSKAGSMDALSDTRWERQYKRQLDIYQWLLRNSGFSVSNIGYFLYANGKKDLEKFDSKLEFDLTIIPYIGNPEWIEDTLISIKNCLDSDSLPKIGEDCEYCNYANNVQEKVKGFAKKGMDTLF